jgi:hypothetical protein
MHIVISGPEDEVLLLAAVCARAGHTVAVRGRGRGLSVRLVGSDGWERYSILEDGSRGEVNVQLAGSDPMAEHREQGEERALIVGDFDVHAMEIEQTSHPSFVLCERAGGLYRLLCGAATPWIRVERVRDLGGCGASRFIYRLLWLPAAMCGTTVSGLLASEAGRRIAGGTLREGVAVCERLGASAGALPVHDPRRLLARLARDPRSLSLSSQAPDRSHPPPARAIASGDSRAAEGLQRVLLRHAQAAGVEVEWNWRITRKVGYVCRRGPYRTPSDLESAI